jgi:hypothetical protein
MSAEPMLELQIEGIPFRYGSPYGVSTPEALFIGKQEQLAQDYLELMRGAGGNIVELGIFQGGSAAATALLASPQRLVVVDRCEPVEALDRFIVDQGLEHVLHPHYGVDQGDRELMTRIVTDEFGAAPLDLVVDDASHLYGPTRTSFEVLFPRLRPGGRFLIEDWHWELQYSYLMTEAERLGPLVDAAAAVLADPTHPDHAQTSTALARLAKDPTNPTSRELSALLAGARIVPVDTGYRAMAQLGVELLTLSAVRPDIVAKVSFDQWWIDVVRGPAELPVDGFDLLAQHRGVARFITP